MSANWMKNLELSLTDFKERKNRCCTSYVIKKQQEKTYQEKPTPWTPIYSERMTNWENLKLSMKATAIVSEILTTSWSRWEIGLRIPKPRREGSKMIFVLWLMKGMTSSGKWMSWTTDMKTMSTAWMERGSRSSEPIRHMSGCLLLNFYSRFWVRPLIRELNTLSRRSNIVRRIWKTLRKEFISLWRWWEIILLREKGILSENGIDMPWILYMKTIRTKTSSDSTWIRRSKLNSSTSGEKLISNVKEAMDSKWTAWTFYVDSQKAKKQELFVGIFVTGEIFAWGKNPNKISCSLSCSERRRHTLDKPLSCGWRTQRDRDLSKDMSIWVSSSPICGSSRRCSWPWNSKLWMLKLTTK